MYSSYFLFRIILFSYNLIINFPESLFVFFCLETLSFSLYFSFLNFLNLIFSDFYQMCFTLFYNCIVSLFLINQFRLSFLFQLYSSLLISFSFIYIFFSQTTLFILIKLSFCPFIFSFIYSISFYNFFFEIYYTLVFIYIVLLYYSDAFKILSHLGMS